MPLDINLNLNINFNVNRDENTQDKKRLPRGPHVDPEFLKHARQDLVIKLEILRRNYGDKFHIESPTEDEDVYALEERYQKYVDRIYEMQRYENIKQFKEILGALMCKWLNV